MKGKLILLIMAVPLILTFVVFSMTSYASIKTNVAVAGVEIEGEEFVNLDLAENDTIRFNARVFPAGATNKNVRYECEKINSSDNVSWEISSSAITFFGYGQVRVKVRTVDGNYKDSVVVFVSSSKLIDFNILTDDNKINIGDEIDFNIKTLPHNFDYESVVWSSSNVDIISIDNMGKAIAKSAGESVITAVVTSAGEKFTRTKKVVVEKMDLANIALIEGKENAEVKTLSSTHSFTAVINLPAFENEVNSNDFSFEYGSEIKDFQTNITYQNNQIVLNNTLTFNSNFYGDSVIKLKYLETIIATLSVKRAEFLSKEDCDFYKLNDYISKSTRGYYSINHLADERVYFEVVSSDKDILQLSQSGDKMMFNAKSCGSVVVTAYCYYGDEIKFSFSKTVNVVKLYSTITFKENTKDYFLNKVDDFYLANEYIIDNEIKVAGYEPNILVEGNKLNDDLVTLTSSDTSVAKIEKGKIVVLSEGEVVITAQNRYAVETADTVKAELKIKCVLGVNAFTYEDLVIATESGKQVVIQSDIMLGKKIVTTNEDGTTTLASDAAQVLSSEVKYIETTADWTFYKNIGLTKPKIAYIIEFKNNVYGNGYSINGEYITNVVDNTGTPYDAAVFSGPLDLVKLTNIASVKAQDNIVFLIRNSSVTLSNVELKGCEGENINDLTKLNHVGTVLEVMGDNVVIEGCNILNGRNCVRIYGDYYDSDKVINVTLDRCVIRYAREFLLKMGTNKYVLGDISSGATLEEKYALAAPSLEDYDHNLDNSKNNDFAQKYIKTYVDLVDSMLATSGIFAIGIESKFAGPCLDGESYGSWDLYSEGWFDLAGTSYASVLNIIGDVRIYDWKRLDDIDSSTLIEVEGNDVHGLLFDLKGIINDACSKEEYTNLISMYNNEKYVHGGIVKFGGGKNYSVVNLSQYEGGVLNTYKIGFSVLQDDRQKNIIQMTAGKLPFEFRLYDENNFSVERQVYDFSTGEAFTYLIK